MIRVGLNLHGTVEVWDDEGRMDPRDLANQVSEALSRTEIEPPGSYDLGYDRGYRNGIRAAENAAVAFDICGGIVAPEPEEDPRPGDST